MTYTKDECDCVYSHYLVILALTHSGQLWTESSTADSGQCPGQSFVPASNLGTKLSKKWNGVWHVNFEVKTSIFQVVRRQTLTNHDLLTPSSFCFLYIVSIDERIRCSQKSKSPIHHFFHLFILLLLLLRSSLFPPDTHFSLFYSILSLLAEDLLRT